MFCRLGDVLSRRIVEVADRSDLRSIPIIEKISFGGVISVTDPDSRESYRGRLFWAEVGDLIYSKIRAKQGSLVLISSEVGRLAVSAEYPVYSPNPAKVVPDYLTLLLRCSSFLRFLEGIASGGDTKTRISPDLFESLRVALPPLASQQAIVDHWKATQKKNAAAHRAADEHEVEIQSAFLAQLGIKRPTASSGRHMLALKWSNLERWGVEGLRQKMVAIDPASGTFPVSRLGQIVDMVQYGTSDKANELGKGTAVLRMNNIHEGVLRPYPLKHVELADKERQSLLLRDGDILFNRTNSKELVGKCAVFHEKGEYVFASYLIRVRVSLAVADPDFIAFILNGSIGRQQIDSMSRQIIGQANINSQELRSLRIPLPPLPIQKQLVAELTAAREKIAADRAAAAKLAADTAREVEEMILGHRPAPIPR